VRSHLRDSEPASFERVPVSASLAFNIPAAAQRQRTCTRGEGREKKKKKEEEKKREFLLSSLSIKKTRSIREWCAVINRFPSLTLAAAGPLTASRNEEGEKGGRKEKKKEERGKRPRSPTTHRRASSGQACPLYIPGRGGRGKKKKRGKGEKEGKETPRR